MDLTENPIKELTKIIKKDIKFSLSHDRYKHSVRVAKMCKKLCKLWGLNKDLGRLAGIAHDMCKGLDADKLIELATQDGKPFSAVERAKPDLLHGRAAAIMLVQKYNFDDKDVKEAIANHTFGAPGMGNLAKVLFVADKIEPGRPFVTKKYLAAIYRLSINEATAQVLRENIDYVKSKHYIISPATLAFMQSLEGNDERQ